jgi:hypothetical protein
MILSLAEFDKYKVVKVILIKNTILQRIEQLNSIECNYIRN